MEGRLSRWYVSPGPVWSSWRIWGKEWKAPWEMHCRLGWWCSWVKWVQGREVAWEKQDIRQEWSHRIRDDIWEWQDDKVVDWLMMISINDLNLLNAMSHCDALRPSTTLLMEKQPLDDGKCWRILSPTFTQISFFWRCWCRLQRSSRLLRCCRFSRCCFSQSIFLICVCGNPEFFRWGRSWRKKAWYSSDWDCVWLCWWLQALERLVSLRWLSSFEIKKHDANFNWSQSCRWSSAS